jgi:hypothetical protein
MSGPELCWLGDVHCAWFTDVTATLQPDSCDMWDSFVVCALGVCAA